MKNNVKLEMLKKDRLGEIRNNNLGCPMKIIEYNSSRNIVVEFQDEYKEKVSTTYRNFQLGSVRNSYYPSVHGVGIVGNKYPTQTKEYNTWRSMLGRCFNEELKRKNPTYKDVTCCKEWLWYDNFYEWLHNQENFEKWLINERWCLDKDIIVKGNKIYSPETCCLVPHVVNTLFVFQNKDTGYLVGVRKYRNKFIADGHQFGNNNSHHIGIYDTELEAFNAYKQCKENGIKKVAIEEYADGNITKKCHDAMMSYKVEIND